MAHAMSYFVLSSFCLQYSARVQTDAKEFTKKCECFVEKRAHSSPFGRDARCEHREPIQQLWTDLFE